MNYCRSSCSNLFRVIINFLSVKNCGEALYIKSISNGYFTGFLGDFPQICRFLGLSVELFLGDEITHLPARDYATLLHIQQVSKLQSQIKQIFYYYKFQLTCGIEL